MSSGVGRGVCRKKLVELLGNPLLENLSEGLRASFGNQVPLQYLLNTNPD